MRIPEVSDPRLRTAYLNDVEIKRVYPPETDRVRAFLMDEIKRIEERTKSALSEFANLALQHPRVRQDIEERHLQAVQPYIDELVKLEQRATFQVLLAG